MKLIAVIISVMVLFMNGVVTQAETKVWNFDNDKADTIAKDFTSEVGEWKVIVDDTAPSKPHVLAQLAKNSGSTFNLALVNSTDRKDVDLSVQMKPIAGDEDQGGGLVWRVKDANNYYVVRYNPLESNYRVYKVVNGERTQLQSADIKHRKGWYILRVTMVDNHIECYYGGKKYLEVKDSALPEVGKIGLWTKADARTYFDNLMLNSE
ncbi:MAG: hypothetical protein DWB56_10010 [Candidatus Jettenia sp.]|uniref:3-keto-disaccharide hydrolase domain-containing protein n=1 Tax=Candidatus Jettenia caeni TaxID=247490 RepID=I3II28_9BACT|nr:hypothetical protein [Candidatus Jettenia sp. AMX1]MBC6929281.1 hypothetical protein [Candidatus Jettenia sp.]NUN23487.1 hypothetical protein [Candidatus Jettenia caeni]KAA0250959.1 MAG: hypothetical protein EDM77_02870 [Candidatus Jettenia sp. AMX1]MCE7880250.1 hypothetical protein [Candidatus Jettenia sp. AMX1]MCQ3926326.1 hypothetical protein [Candidatus Jettenia sp.]